MFTYVSLNEKILKFDFGEQGLTAEVEITKFPDHIDFEIIAIQGEADSMTFVNVPLNLEEMSHEPFVGCVLAGKEHEHSSYPASHPANPAQGKSIQTLCGIKGAGIAMLGLPRKKCCRQYVT